MLDGTPEFPPADPMPPEIAALRDSAEPVWIFAYGSLMWDPDFPRAEAEPALLRGYHRSFCLYSYDYRGTRTRPGLTLGLDRGGACRGIVLRLPPETLAEAIDRLWAREMTAPRVYDMRLLPVRTARGVSAWPLPSRCAATTRTMPGGCRSRRPRGSSRVPPAGAAPAATISPIPCTTSPRSA